MKKLNVLIILIVILLIGVVFVASKRSRESSSMKIKEPTTPIYDISLFNSIMPSDIDNFEDDKVYVIFMGSETCQFSKNMISVFKELQDTYDLVTQYINTVDVINLSKDSITNEDEYNYLKNMKKSDGEINIMLDMGRTPFTLFIKNKEITKSYLGYADFETLSNILEELGVEKRD